MNKKQEKEALDRIYKAQARLGKLWDDLMAGKITPKEAKARSGMESAQLEKVKKLLGPLKPLKPLPKLPPLTPKKRKRIVR